MEVVSCNQPDDIHWRSQAMCELFVTRIEWLRENSEAGRSGHLKEGDVISIDWQNLGPNFGFVTQFGNFLAKMSLSFVPRALI